MCVARKLRMRADVTCTFSYVHLLQRTQYIVSTPGLPLIPHDVLACALAFTVALIRRPRFA